MITGSNGTDEGVLRTWLDAEFDFWQAALFDTLIDAIEHLHELCFGDAWRQLESEGLPEERVQREVLSLYQDGLTDIFTFVRIAGALPDDLAWSRLKAGHRRAAADQGRPAGDQEALTGALYTAEQTPSGDHRRYRGWARALMLFVYQHAANGPAYPGLDAEDDDKLRWAYDALRDIEDHQNFHAALAGYLKEPGVTPVAAAILGQALDDVIAWDRQLLEQARFDLILNTGLRWLVGAVERHA